MGTNTTQPTSGILEKLKKENRKDGLLNGAFVLAAAGIFVGAQLLASPLTAFVALATAYSFSFDLFQNAGRGAAICKAQADGGDFAAKAMARRERHLKTGGMAWLGASSLFGLGIVALAVPALAVPPVLYSILGFASVTLAVSKYHSGVARASNDIAQPPQAAPAAEAGKKVEADTTPLLKKLSRSLMAVFGVSAVKGKAPQDTPDTAAKQAPAAPAAP